MTAVCCASCWCCASRQARAHLTGCGAALPVLLVVLGAGYFSSWGLFPGSPALGAVLAGAVSYWAGRRAALVLSVPLQAATALLLAFEDPSPAARSTCAGAAVPLAVVPGLFYLAELSGPWTRGLSCSSVLMAYLGGRTLAHYLKLLPDVLPLALGGLAPGLVGLLLAGVLPASPYFLVLRGRAAAVPRVLARLRGLRDARAEAEEVVECVREQRASCCAGNLRGPILAVLLCGSLPLLGGPLTEFHLAALDLGPPPLVRASCGLLQLAAVSLCAALSDWVGRRPLVVLASGCVALGNATCGYFHFFLGFPARPGLPWQICLAALAVSLFGQGLLAGVCWVLFAEVLPLRAKLFVPFLVFLLDGILQLAVVPPVRMLLEWDVLRGDGKAFPAAWYWGCALWSVVLGTIAGTILPETKGCSLSQVHGMLRGLNRRSERTRM